MGIVSLVAKIRLDGVNETRRGLQSIQVEFRQTAEAGHSASRGANAFSASLSALANAARGAVGVVGRVTAAMGAGGAGLGFVAFQAATRMDSLTRALATVAKGSGDLQDQLIRLQEVAKLPGLSFEEAVKGSVSLQAAGLSARLAERSLTAFGNAVASAGGRSEDLGEVIRQLSQIAGAGKFAGDELRVIAERAPQTRRAILAAFGTTDSAAINKLGLSVEQMVDRIVTQVERLPKASGGVANLLENLSDRFNRSIVPLGQGIASIFEKISPSLDRLLSKAESLFTRIGAILERFGQTGALNRLIDNMASLLDSRKVDEFFASFLAGVTVLANNLPAIIQTVTESIGGMFASVGEGIQKLKAEGASSGKAGYIGAGMMSLGLDVTPGEWEPHSRAKAREAAGLGSGRRLDEIFAKMSFEFLSLRNQLLGVGQTPAAARSQFPSQEEINRLIQEDFDRTTYPGDRAWGRARKSIWDYADASGRLSDGSMVGGNNPFAGGGYNGYSNTIDLQLAEIERNTRSAADSLSLRRVSTGGGQLARIGVTPVEMGRGYSADLHAPLIPANSQLQRAVRTMIQQESHRITGQRNRIGG